MALETGGSDDNHNAEIVRFGSLKTGATPIKRKLRERIYSYPRNHMENIIAKRNKDCCGLHVRLCDPTGDKKYFGRGECDMCGKNTWDYCIGCYRHFCNSSSKAKFFKVIHDLPGGKQKVYTFRATCFLIKHKEKMEEHGLRARGLPPQSHTNSPLESNEKDNSTSISNKDKNLTPLKRTENVVITPNTTKKAALSKSSHSSTHSSDHEITSTSTSTSLSNAFGVSANVSMTSTLTSNMSTSTESNLPIGKMKQGKLQK